MEKEISTQQFDAEIEGKKIAKEFVNTLNSMTYEKDVARGFVEEVVNSHRTLQQSTMRAIYKLLEKWAEMKESGNFDARNEATVSFCSKVKEMAEKENLGHFPFI